MRNLLNSTTLKALMLLFVFAGGMSFLSAQAQIDEGNIDGTEKVIAIESTDEIEAVETTEADVSPEEVVTTEVTDQKQETKESNEYKHALGLNITNRIPFIRGRRDDTFLHFTTITEKNNFRKHSVLLDFDLSKVSLSDDNSVIAEQARLKFTTGYNFAFGRRKSLGKHVNLFYGPTAGYKYSRVRSITTFPNSENETVTAKHPAVHQVNAGLLGGLEVNLTPRLSLYTEANLLMRGTFNGSQSSAVEQVNLDLKPDFNFSRNIVIFYKF